MIGRELTGIPNTSEPIYTTNLTVRWGDEVEGEGARGVRYAADAARRDGVEAFNRLLIASMPDITESFGAYRHQSAVPGGHVFMGCLLGFLAV